MNKVYSLSRWLMIVSSCLRLFANVQKSASFSFRRIGVRRSVGDDVIIKSPFFFKNNLKSRYTYAGIRSFGEGPRRFVSENENEDDTIFALSSGPIMYTATAISVIRLSGPRSHEVLAKLCNSSNKKQSLPPIRKACVRYMYDDEDKLIDQAMVLRFEGPSSFTGEDMVELHCHGSRAVTNHMLEYLASSATTEKVRPAEKGEFTQRAYGAGKLNLLQVEALADLLSSDTKSQAQLALRQYNGELYDLYTSWQKILTKALAHTEAVLDFGEDDLDVNDDIDSSILWGQDILSMLLNLQLSMKRHLQCQAGEWIRTGIRVAIVGPPNAGKSSFLNALANRDVAIVSPIAGTTRDVVSLQLDLKGVRVTLYDTAGLRTSTQDTIEQQGIERAQQVTQNAHIVLCMQDITTTVSSGTNDLNGDDSNNIWQSMLFTENDQITDDDKSPFYEDQLWYKPHSKTQNNVFMIYNKADLMAQDDSHICNRHGEIPKFINTKDNLFQVSCQTQEGIPQVIERLTKVVQHQISNTSASTEQEGEDVYLTRERHRKHVQASYENLKQFFILAEQGVEYMDLAAEELRCANTQLGRILGAVDVEDVLDVLFADFCIGK